ncbi:MAG: heavy metal translocating P-type ATPase [Bacillota bacterium]|nr:heavy metal translocating P-type ATPase [Bacillota bacterium]
MLDKYKSLTKGQKSQLNKILIAGGLLILAFIVKDYQYFTLAALAGSYLLVGLDVLKLSLYNIKNGQVFDENFLMSIATLGAIGLGDYYEAVFVMLFYQAGEFFEDLAVGKSRKSIQSLLEYAPDQVRVLRHGKEEIVDPEDVNIGEIISVLPGEKVALDGQVIKGSSSLNLAFLTGESLPVDIGPADQVPSGAINLSGHLQIQVEKTFDDSTVSKILELIEESSEKKSVLENFINRFSRYYTPVVVFSALFLAILPPLIFNQAFGPWFKRALIFLVVSCPCALVLSIPLAFFAGVGKASRSGILVKGSNYLEALAKVDSLVFDKTGTLTEGNFEIIEENSYSQVDFRSLAGSLEAYSNHPIARSIEDKYGSKEKDQITEVQEIHGRGLVGTYQGKVLLVGNEKLLADYNIEIIQSQSLGSKVYVAYDQKLIGSLVIADIIKDGAKKALEDLRQAGVKNLVLLTGDKDQVGQEVGSYLGFDQVYSELLPADKLEIFESILEKSKKDSMVAYVGDGINDAPTIVRADVGIAMGALGTDAAIEAADLVLMDDKLDKLPRAIEISKETLATAKFNVVFSLGIKILVLILSVFGLATMWMAIFADVGVMLIAILNSMRLMKE